MPFLQKPKQWSAPRVSDISSPSPVKVMSDHGKRGRNDQSNWYEPAVSQASFSQTSSTFSVPSTPLSVWQPQGRPGTRKRPGLWQRQRGVLWTIILLLILGAGGVAWRAAFLMKERTLLHGQNGYEQLALAVESLKTQQYRESAKEFTLAHQSFEEASQELPSWGKALVDLTRFVPGLSQISSGKNVVEAGKYFSLAGVSLSQIAQGATSSKDAYAQGEKISLLHFLSQMKAPINEASTNLQKAEEALDGVNMNDVPAGKREKFLLVKTTLPTLLSILTGITGQEALLQEFLGGNGPRKYLFLLQNNHEMRATGGFIGSYALLDVNDGVVRRFFVDGIFNPDGQLKENIVPPKPIQKISAAWSLHDSNWFPDFPTSAEKAIFFYEKTGGPTVDGIITLTPTVMQRLLAVTGPIALPQYGITVDADNFITVVQEQVEVKYDKEINQPKKILADLSFMLIEKVFASQDRRTLASVAQVLVTGLDEKHILLYMRHKETEALLDTLGWSGRLLTTPKDYLAVIHSNINGYKTDGVIDEKIEHKATIADDGSIIDTVTITRKHNGGNTPYDWWNKVNADYLRVYVPAGSQLLSAKGATWEFPPAPLDYERLGFEKDAEVEQEERGTTIDEQSGTRISSESGKTVFGAWVYVSPQESVTVEYQYRLPFRLALNNRQNAVDSYSVLYQKQSGSLGSKLSSVIEFPAAWKTIWQSGTNLVPYGRMLKAETTLTTDVFEGMVFAEK